MNSWTTPSRDWNDSEQHPLTPTKVRLTSLDSFFIIAFASYVESQKDFSQTFFEWLQVCCPNFGVTCRGH